MFAKLIACAPLIELIILLASAVFVVFQIHLLKKQIRNHHEERRRENTISFMSMWCNSVKKDTCIAEQVARDLNNEQCQCLYNHTPFTVSEKTKKSICKFCPLAHDMCDSCSLKNSTTVDGKILTELRWHVVTYLNTLETVMIAWHLGIVDKETIEEQFQFVNDPLKACSLSEFRHTAGGYPAIEAFVDKIKRNSTSTGKNELS